MRVPAYAVEDRSLLLPLYKRFLVEPAVRLIPASVHPNVVTHVAHLMSLGAAACVVLGPAGSGLRFVAAAVLVQLYCLGDNADGAHARRTGQSSRYGEFLDHGLDSLSVLYIAIVTSALLAAPPFWWVVMAASAPGAAAVVYWEQNHTGVMRLGLLNQVEGILVLAVALVATAVFGTDLWRRLQLFGVDGRTALLAWTLTTFAFGALRGIARVAARAPSIAPTVLAPVAALAGIVASAGVGAVSTAAAIAATTSVSVYWSTHMLALRFGREVGFETAVFTATALAFGGLAGWSTTARGAPPFAGLAAVLLCVSVFAVMLARDVASVRSRLLAGDPMERGVTR